VRPLNFNYESFFMPNYTALESNISCDPVLFLNPDADARGLLETATQRITSPRRRICCCRMVVTPCRRWGGKRAGLAEHKARIR
jgi:hypothetical protein